MASHGVPRAAALVQKSEKALAEERKQIEEYKSLETQVQEKIRDQDFSNATLQLTSSLLTRNPEYYTIWNNRRLILQDVFRKESQNSADETESSSVESTDAEAARKAGLTLAQQEIALLIKEDLQFLVPLLKQYPKCYWIWNHRAWLLATATQHLPAATSAELWKGELGLVSKMLALDSRNFHGWGYRRIAVRNLESLSGRSMVEPEFEYTTKMINSNLSNFSAWHNRGQLLPRLLDERKADAEQRKKVFDDELELITTALYTDSYDQSLWFYHQFLLSALDTNNPNAPRLLEPCTDTDRAHYLNQEIDSVREMLDGAEDCKYIYQALLEYSQQCLRLRPDDDKVEAEEMRTWLDELVKIDPLRQGRWDDLAKKLRL